MIIVAPGCVLEFGGAAASHACISVSRMKHVEKPFFSTVALNWFFRDFLILKLKFTRSRTVHTAFFRKKLYLRLFV